MEETKRRAERISSSQAFPRFTIRLGFKVYVASVFFGYFQREFWNSVTPIRGCAIKKAIQSRILLRTFSPLFPLEILLRFQSRKKFRRAKCLRFRLNFFRGFMDAVSPEACLEEKKKEGRERRVYPSIGRIVYGNFPASGKSWRTLHRFRSVWQRSNEISRWPNTQKRALFATFREPTAR